LFVWFTQGYSMSFTKEPMRFYAIKLTSSNGSVIRSVVAIDGNVSKLVPLVEHKFKGFKMEAKEITGSQFDADSRKYGNFFDPAWF